MDVTTSFAGRVEMKRSLALGFAFYLAISIAGVSGNTLHQVANGELAGGLPDCNFSDINQPKCKQLQGSTQTCPTDATYPKPVKLQPLNDLHAIPFNPDDPYYRCRIGGCEDMPVDKISGMECNPNNTPVPEEP
jgi:hypothetical protein